MNTPFLLAGVINVANKNPLVALIAKFSAIGIALGVAVLIVGLSAMNGFERELNQRILAVVPHIEIFLRIKRKIPHHHWQNLENAYNKIHKLKESPLLALRHW